MGTKRMGGLGKLSDFGQSTVSQPTTESKPPVRAKTTAPKPAPEQEKLVTVNIKINRSQQEWLADTARQVRDNNSTPVPPKERVYPQHLIGVAINLLQSSDIDWAQVHNVEDLKQALKL